MSVMPMVYALVKILVMVGFVFNVAALLTWYDRRGGAMMQDRIGPNRAGFKIGPIELRVAGLLHTAADGLKFFTKKDFMPPKADKLLFSLAPILTLAPVLVLVAVVPFGDTILPDHLWGKICLKAGDIPRHLENGKCALDGYEATTVFPYFSSRPLGEPALPIDLVVAPLNVGLLFVFAVAGQGIVAAAIAGLASDNKFSLMGGLRAASQMVSYEVTMGLTLIGAMMIYGTVRLDEMVRWQGANAWGIFVQPVAFVLFFCAAIAETKRIPFDLPEAESELVSGYFTEYSGMKFGMFYFAEYMEVVTSSMLLVTIFLGGWQLPFFHPNGIVIAFGETVVLTQKVPHIWMVVLGVVTFFGKTLLLCWIQAFIRWSLPRFRYDQLMKLGWTVLLPVSLANVFVTGVAWLALQQGGPSLQAGLKVAGDVTQAIVAGGATFLLVKMVIGFVKTPRRRNDVVGSSASLAAAAGGTSTGPMQF